MTRITNDEFMNLRLRHSLLFFLILFTCQNIAGQRVGLVLSGGGAKGIAHAGLIKALEENHIPIDYITGTSIGAIVGGLYAIGYSPEEMMQLFMSEKFLMWQTGQVEEDYKYYFKKPKSTPEFVNFKVGINDSSSIVPHILPKSLTNPIQLNYAFMEMFGSATAACNGDFNELFVPFRCVASDINNKQPVIFGNGDLGDAVRASMSFPFVFKSIKVDSVLLFDGGIYDNFPVQPMKRSFNPDYIIGSVVATKTEESQIDENNLFDQLESMIMQKTRYRLRRQDGDGLVVRYELQGVGLLDFDKAEELFKIGYEKGLQYVDSIKQKVTREIYEEDVELRRMLYKSKLPELVFKDIHITGVNNAQKEYIENAIRRNNQEFTLDEFKIAYFKLLADSKISEVIPHAIYNPQRSNFELHLEVIMDENLTVSFGGNISSSNSNQAYMGIGYQSLNKYAISYNLEGNFGVSYNSVMLSGRIDLPTRQMPMYLRIMGAHASQKYYNSDNLFYSEDVLAFIRQKETYAKVRIGFPFLMKGKAEVSVGYGEINDAYYQSNNVSFSETDFDNSRYRLGVGTFRIEHNSLNYKMYETEGRNWYMVAQLAAGKEKYVSAPIKLEEGWTQTIRENKNHSWMQIKGLLRNYKVVSPSFNYGVHLESVVSGKNFFSNYTASVIQAPAFTPTPHSKTMFNEKLRANQYFAGGFIPIWKLNRLFHLRGEFYAFLPFNEIIRSETNQALQGEFMRDFQYLGEVSLVCQLPFISIAAFVNKYSYPSDNWNFGLNIGYLIFNTRLIEL